MISRAILRISRKPLIMLLVIMAAVTSLWAGQWTALGPEGGDVRSLSSDPNNPDRIYLGSSTGTLFLSTDGGHSWSRLAHLKLWEAGHDLKVPPFRCGTGRNSGLFPGRGAKSHRVVPGPRIVRPCQACRQGIGELDASFSDSTPQKAARRQNPNFAERRFQFGFCFRRKFVQR